MVLTSRSVRSTDPITYTLPSRFVLTESEQDPAHRFSCPVCMNKKAKAEQEPDEEKREKKLKKIKRTAWPTKGELTRHVIYHRGKYPNKQTLYVCQLHDCDVNVFTDLGEFLHHQNSHPQLEHVCMSTNCPYRLESKTDLLEHLTSHDHETPYVCRRPNCDVEFQYYSARKIHEDNHFEPIAISEASDVESEGDFGPGADRQTERSSTDATRVASTSAEPTAKDEHEEKPEGEGEESEDGLEAEMEADMEADVEGDVEADAESETSERVVDSDSDGDGEAKDWRRADRKSEIDAYNDWRASMAEIDNQLLVAKRSRKLAKIAMDKFESDELFYSWLLNHSGKGFAVDQEKMLENRVKDAHERYLGARILNLGSMRMDPLAMGQVESILMEWVMDEATDAEGNAFKTIRMSEEPKTDEEIKESRKLKRMTSAEALVIVRE